MRLTEPIPTPRTERAGGDRPDDATPRAGAASSPVASPAASAGGGAVLDPVERLSEILFGLIMAMTFTGSIHAAQAGEEDVRTILVGALGCNIAWGIVDAFMYLMSELVTRGHVRRSLRALHHASSAEQVRDILDEVLPEGVIRAMKPADYDALRRWVDGVPDEVRGRPLTARTWRGALGVFLLVTLSTFPVVIPLFVLSDPTAALRVSHGVTTAMLFGIGFAFGKRAGINAWLTGLSMLLLGVLLAGLTILLGG